jgi:hypothetical protein
MGSIIAILFATSHILHFAAPILQLTSSNDEISDNPDDMTTTEFLTMMAFYESYNWTEYDTSDFPSWMYMPDTYPSHVDLNQSDNEPIPIFWSYDWDHYDASDFPNWIDAPTTLPSNFTTIRAELQSEYHGSDGWLGMWFVSTYIDPEFLAEIESSVESGDSEIVGQIAGIFALPAILSTFVVLEIFGFIIWLAVAIILFIVSRSVD